MAIHFYSDLKFQASPKRPIVACNMVMSLDGKVTADGKQPDSLGSSFDLLTMNVIRSHFDAVLAGGNTIRQFPFYLGVRKELEATREKMGLVSQPLTVLLTKSGKLNAQTPLFTNPPRPPVIITSAKGAENLDPRIKAQSKVEVVENPNPQKICALLWENYQVQHLLVEGGPSVNYQFMQAQYLDELFLTLSPHLIGKRTDLNVAMGDQVLEKAEQIKLLSTNQHSDELFLRYRISW